MKGLNLGTGLFSEASKAVATSKFRIQHIPLEKLRTIDEEHGFSLDDIEELAASIADVGLQQNLVVEEAEDGYYNILTGRRRFNACKLLTEQGNDKYSTLPCIVINLADIDLPIDEATKRMYAILTTNSEQRKLTPADRAEMIRKAGIVYEALEAAGHKPRGRRRDFIAEQLGVSSSTIGNYEYIEKHTDDATKSELMTGKKSLRNTMDNTPKMNCANVGTITGKRNFELTKQDIFGNIPYDELGQEIYRLNGDELQAALEYIKQINVRFRKLVKLLNNAKK